MKKCTILFVLLAALTSVRAQYNTQNIRMGSASYQWSFGDASENVAGNTAISEVEKQFTYGNLRLYMLKGNSVIQQSARNLGNYLSLQEAMKTGKLVVSESGSGTVNNLIFENTSHDTILILAGEVVTGGKQDRVVAQDLLLLPGSGKTTVDVFCVEQGRWTPNGTGYQFTGTFGVAGADVRKNAVVNKNQGEVWKSVAETHKKNKTGTASGTYTSIANSDSLNMQVSQYMAHFQELMLADSSYIGFVAVSADTILSCDIFANHALYKQHAPGLLKAASVQAISHGAAVTIGSAAVAAFLREILSNESDQEEKILNSGTILKKGEQKIHINYYPKSKK